uniref:Uncharacterized protein n=1 Tax=Nicotiana tabacum TaxID=4097 RepID=A0A1S3X6C5_TOBAC
NKIFTVVGSTSNVATSSRSVPPPAPAEKPEKFSVNDFKETTLDNERFIVTKAWKHSDFLCKNYILSGLEDDLYNVYSNAETSKVLWDALDKKYKIEDAGLVINEAFQVATMIEKLPRLWRDFQNYLKNKCREMKLEDLIVRLRIEEDNKATKNKTRGNSTILGENIIETAPTNSKKRKKPFGPNNYPNKKKFKGNSCNRRKGGHKATECRAPKKEKKKGQENMVEPNDDIDDLEAFASYASTGPDETNFMKNSSTTKIEGYGKIFLKMTSSKVVTLNN